MSNINNALVIQAHGGTIGGTAAETQRGSEVDLRFHDFMTLYVNYIKGSEGTLYVYPKFSDQSGGTAYPWGGWATEPGDVARTANRLKLTANTAGYYRFDVRGINYVTFWSLPVGNNNGTVGLFVTLEGDE